MTAPLRSTPRPSAIPASQTAPVAEFRCLFTHDIKRKQKRWQDGYLKFHSFNSRVMVYDQSRNHVGDTYWKESNELQEGDELSLDRGVMVEVAEARGVTQTDLKPLFEKRPKEPTNQPPSHSSVVVLAPTAPRPFQRPSSIAPGSAVRGGSQLRHKSLNSLLGPSKGPVGKALPIKSPYETRKDQENEWATERAAKRQKVVQPPSDWRASSPAEAQSSPHKVSPVTTKTAAPSTTKYRQACVPRPAKVITISSDTDVAPVTTSDVTLPSTPAGKKSRPSIPAIPSPAVLSSTVGKPAQIRAERAPRPTVPRPNKKPAEIPQRTAPTSSPPVSATNRLTNVDVAVQPAQRPPKNVPPQASPPPNPKAKSLRLSVGVKRGTLILQTLPVGKTTTPFSRAPTGQACKSIRKETFSERHVSENPPARLSTEATATANKRKSAHNKAQRTESIFDMDDVFENPEIAHGIMDEKLLLSSPLTRPQQAPFSTNKDEAAEITNNAQDSDASEPLINEHTEKSRNRKQPKQTSRAKSTEKEKRDILRLGPVFEPPRPVSRDVSPAHADISAISSRNGSASPSKPLLSTGGIRKKQKQNSNTKSENLSNGGSARQCPDHNVSLPPHPVQQIMTAAPINSTEPASRSQKQNKRSRENDAVTEATACKAKSPSRSFRRVVSENDAPIPSTAADWEKRNLPMASSNLTEMELVEDPAPAPKKAKVGGLAAVIKRTDPRNKFQRTTSLNLEETPAHQVEPALPSPVVDKDIGPWSTEAFDLFDWRPPKRD